MKKKWYLGRLKDNSGAVYLEDFSWECRWYWSGGSVGNSQFSCHFDGCFLDCPDSRGHSLGPFFDPWTKPPEYVKNAKIMGNGCAIWESLKFFLDDPQYTEKQWWRIKDLFKQFYLFQRAAEAFQYGGHCTTDKRSEKEINPFMAGVINKHIETVIIPEIRRVLNEENGIDAYILDFQI